MYLRGCGGRPNRPQTWLRQPFFSPRRPMDMRVRPPRWLNPRWLRRPSPNVLVYAYFFFFQHPVLTSTPFVSPPGLRRGLHGGRLLLRRLQRGGGRGIWQEARVRRGPKGGGAARRRTRRGRGRWYARRDRRRPSWCAMAW